MLEFSCQPGCEGHTIYPGFPDIYQPKLIWWDSFQVELKWHTAVCRKWLWRACLFKHRDYTSSQLHAAMAQSTLSLIAIISYQYLLISSLAANSRLYSSSIASQREISSMHCRQIVRSITSHNRRIIRFPNQWPFDTPTSFNSNWLVCWLEVVDQEVKETRWIYAKLESILL